MPTQEIKLLRHNQANSTKVIPIPRKLSVSKRSVFRLSLTLKAEMGVEVGSRVALMQSATDPTAWWITEDKKNGFPLRKIRDGSVRFMSVEMGKKFLDAINWKRPTGAMPVGEKVKIHGEDMWPLHTKEISYTGSEKD